MLRMIQYLSRDRVLWPGVCPPPGLLISLSLRKVDPSLPRPRRAVAFLHSDAPFLLSSVVPVLAGAVEFFLSYMVLADDGLGGYRLRC